VNSCLTALTALAPEVAEPMCYSEHRVAASKDACCTHDLIIGGHDDLVNHANAFPNHDRLGRALTTATLEHASTCYVRLRTDA
jgi:hypothetical protein